jgi:hypothetical protein
MLIGGLLPVFNKKRAPLLEKTKFKKFARNSFFPLRVTSEDRFSPAGREKKRS